MKYISLICEINAIFGLVNLYFHPGHVTLFLHMSEHSALIVLQTGKFLYLLIFSLLLIDIC